MGKKITSLVNTEAIERNRYYFSTLIDILACLEIHQLIYREKINAFESKDEGKMDSFYVLFNYTVEKDKLFRVIITTISIRRVCLKQFV